MAYVLVFLSILFLLSTVILILVIVAPPNWNKSNSIDREFYKIAEMLDDVFPDDIKDL
jgi:hypothetical protein